MANRLIFIFLAFYFWIGALWQGYFLETAYLCSNLFLYAGLLVMIGLKRELLFCRTHLFVLLFVAGYWISVLYAIDVEQAVLEAARVSGLIPLSLMIKAIPHDRARRVYGIWPWIGALLTIAGILFQMERNGRLESTLEYANALAIFLLVNIGICIMLYLKERHIAILGLLTVNAVGLLLTFSRSVWVLWLVMVAMAVMWFPALRRRPAWLSVGISHLCGIVIALLIKGDTFFFWQRVSSIQSNTSELQIRLVYWKDSWEMIRDYWLGGTGGGGWNVLVHLYRSQDYFVRFVHNHFIQVTLDIGVFGLLALAAWLGIFYWVGIQRLRRTKDESLLWTKGALLFVTALVVHAGFDFDLTFPLLFGVLVCLTIPMDEKIYKLRVPGRAFGIVVPLAAAAICFWSWLAIGYGYSQAASHYVQARQYTKGQEIFAKAEHLLPWSSSVLYGSAKGYVREGNTSGDASYYNLARDKLVRAHELVPDQTLYTDLLKQLPQNLTRKN